MERTVLQGLRSDAGAANLESLFRETDKLNQLRELNLPDDLFDGISPKIIAAYQQRAAVELDIQLIY